MFSERGKRFIRPLAAAAALSGPAVESSDAHERHVPEHGNFELRHEHVNIHDLLGQLRDHIATHDFETAGLYIVPDCDGSFNCEAYLVSTSIYYSLDTIGINQNFNEAHSPKLLENEVPYSIAYIHDHPVKVVGLLANQFNVEINETSVWPPSVGDVDTLLQKPNNYINTSPLPTKIDSYVVDAKGVWILTIPNIEQSTAHATQVSIALRKIEKGAYGSELQNAYKEADDLNYTKFGQYFLTAEGQDMLAALHRLLIDAGVDEGINAHILARLQLSSLQIAANQTFDGENIADSIAPYSDALTKLGITTTFIPHAAANPQFERIDR